MKNNAIKKVTKRFSDFSKEEEWLQSMLNEGWILKGYDSEDIGDCHYIFERTQSEKSHNIIYKIDFRNFDKKREFEEYKEIFQDSGWTLLSKSKWYSKHIFYRASSTNEQSDIFSDQESYIEREKRKRTSLLMYTGLASIGFIIFIVLWIIFDYAYFGAFGLSLLYVSYKYTIDYFKHRKFLKSIL
ncbi:MULTISPECIES: DUF2812 domain-containing protein [Niallia]|uniref:DUF2812 domain-containing protein n=1 Tax=Niallia TaxID=2837506 RepID=UPI00069D6E79|nr:DUF2812 domain-containing protein [Niallia circulans]MED5101776.1 DUF2812 domain-containing protein [Niallia circulans]